MTHSEKMRRRALCAMERYLPVAYLSAVERERETDLILRNARKVRPVVKGMQDPSRLAA